VKNLPQPKWLTEAWSARAGLCTVSVRNSSPKTLCSEHSQR
jgi:hypothetical protein